MVMDFDMCQGTLGKVFVRDTTPRGKKHPDIFSIDGEHMIDYTFETFSAGPEYPGYDSYLHIL